MRYLILVLVVMLTGCINEDKPVANEPEAVIKAYLKAEAESDLVTYKKLAEKQMLSLNDGQLSTIMAYEGDRIRAGNGIKSIALKIKDQSQSLIRYHVIVELNDSDQMNLSLAAVKEEGQWRVVSGG